MKNNKCLLDCNHICGNKEFTSPEAVSTEGAISTQKDITSYINKLIHSDRFALIHLKQGEYFVSKGNPAVVSTVLGPCVSVTLHHPKMRIGAITHGFLPEARYNKKKSVQNPGRFVDSSTEIVYEQMLGLGAKNRDLEVKLFGGAKILENKSAQAVGVGRSNVQVALRTLEKMGLKVKVVEVGGNHSRKIYFLPHSGEVWVKKFSSK